MSISDISEIWQNHEFSEDMIPGPPSLLDQLAFGVYIRPLNDDELVVELEDDPYHSYKVEKRDEVQNSHSMIEDSSGEPQLKTRLLPSILVPNFDNLQDFSEELAPTSNGTEQESSKKKAKNSTTKNIMGYETKKTIKLMFRRHGDYIRKKCKKAGLIFREFKKVYTCAEKKIYGPISIDKMLEVEGEKSEKMRSVFLKIFNKILRKEYLIYSLKLGKMQDMEPYIREKNAKLLYYLERGTFSQMLSKESI